MYSFAEVENFDAEVAKAMKDETNRQRENIENSNPLKSGELNISYCVNFLKKAIETSRNQDYKLVWKLPRIAHKDVKESIVKILAILGKMDLKIDIMSSLIGFDDSLKDKFGIEIYGNYPLNAYNLSTVVELKNYKMLSISPELYSKDIANLLDDYHAMNKRLCDEREIGELEMIVHGNIESMTSRKEIISKKQLKLVEKYNKNQKKKSRNAKWKNETDYANLKNETSYANQKNKTDYANLKNKTAYANQKKETKDSKRMIEGNEFYLKNRKNQYYPIKRSLADDNIIILNAEEFCLINEIEFLKSKGLSNFAIDARWKSADYVEEVGMAYRRSIDGHPDLELSREIIKKYSANASEGNFNTGLK